MSSDHPDHPAVIASPPLIFLAGVIIGALLNWVWPLPLLPGSVSWLTGIVLIVIGLTLGFGALRTLRQAGTTVDPYTANTTVVTNGLYQITRTPIYLGYVIITAGIACCANALWIILALPITVIVIDRGVIAREEDYLERKFGEAYTSYKARVRRWI